jgi:RHS repeat-associated protein
MRGLRLGVLAAALVAAGVAAAQAAAPAAKVTLSGPSSAVAGTSATFRATVRPGRRAIRRATLRLLLSTDAKRDARDAVLVTRGARNLKGRRTARFKLEATIPRATPARGYRLLACLTVGKATRCASRGLQVTAAGAPPKPGGGVVPLPTPFPSPGAEPTPSPTPAPAVVIDTPSPAPGPTDAPAASPVDRADPLADESATSHLDATEFLYTGANPIQAGVAPGTIEVKRSAVVRGRVTNRLGGGIGGVRVSVADHPELGRTATRADGGYDMAVNGGGVLTLVFEREGYLEGQRTVDVPWQDYADVEPLVLIPYDTRGTVVDTTGAGLVAAQGTTVQDASGKRTQTLLFEPGTTAQMEVDGQMKPLGSSFTVRSTEYTIGDSGPAAMPGELPPTTAYTYATELSVDAAAAAGATDVVFSKPVATYLENFLALPVGVPVPTGYYDRELERWVGAPDGLVVGVVAGGIDTDGDGTADNSGIDAAERDKVLAMYPAGTSLWRVEVTHFTPWDFNYPYGPAPDAEPPGPEVGPPEPPPDDPPCGATGSILLCEDQVLAEELPVTGAPSRLVYRSDRVPGRRLERTADIRLVDGPLHESLERVRLVVNVAGTTFERSFTRAEALAAPVFAYEWNGKDAYGRDVQGAQTATVRVEYQFRAVLQRSSVAFGQSWARVSGIPTTAPSRGTFAFSRTSTLKLSAYDARGVGLGGWTLSDHHAYDPDNRTLLRGDGGFVSADGFRVGVLEQLAGAPTLDGPTAVAVGPDGNTFVADTRNQRIRRVTDGGIATVVAGSGAFGYRSADDGGSATEARLSSPRGLAVSEGGAGGVVLHIADTAANRIRRVSPGGTITTVAGGGTQLGDGGAATGARLSLPQAVAAAPDGTLYVADTGQHRVRMIGTDGTISTVAGTGTPGFTGDGGRADEARLRAPAGILVEPSGAILIADTGNGRVRRVGIDGLISTVAGGGSPASGNGDGAAATAARLVEPTALAVRGDGSIVIADPGAKLIREVDPDGTIVSIAGGGSQTRLPGSAPLSLTLGRPDGLAVRRDDSLVFTESADDRLSRMSQALPGFSAGDALIPDRSGSELYQFNASGRHERTLDAITGAVVRRFTYDGQGRLAQVFDDAAGASPAHAPLLTVDRSDPAVTILRARGGAETRLTTTAEGWLSGVRNPANELHVLAPAADGLLMGETDPEGGAHTFAYDDLGRLTHDTGPDGVVQQLTRASVPGGSEVTLSTQGGRITKYRTVVDGLGQVISSITEPSGAVTVNTSRPDGTWRTDRPDGVVVERREAPDPRFGAAAPYPAFLRMTLPSGKSTTSTTTRTAVMRNAAKLESATTTTVLDGRSTTETYTAKPGDAGGTAVVTAPLGRTSTAELDDHGRVVSVKDNATATPLVFQYDDAQNGRLASQTQGTREWSFGYDARQRLKTQTSGEGRVTTLTYDDADRVLSSTIGAATTSETFDDAGRSEQLVVPGGRTTTFSQTAGGKPKQMTLPGGQAFGRTYTGNGSNDVQTLPSGARTEVAFKPGTGDSVVTGIVDRRAAGGPAVVSRSFAYGPNPRLITSGVWTAGAKSQTVDVDYDGDLPTEFAFSGAATGTITRSLATSGLLPTSTTITAGNGPRTYAITHGTDRLVSSFGPFTYGRDAATGALETITDAADATVVETLDTKGFGELDERRLTEAGEERYELVVTHDDEGRVTRREETIGGAAPIVRTYEHDPQGRLTTVRDGGGAIVESYTFDVAGERTSATSEDHGAQAATYNATTGLQTSAGPLTMSFDADGFLTQRGGEPFVYGPGGELLSAEAGDTAITYAYDIRGRRTARSAGGDDTTFLYGNPDNPFEVTASVDDAGALTTYFYDEDGHLHAFERGAARYRVGTDQVGTPRVVVDADGTIVKRVDRDTFGRVLDDSAPAFVLPIGFAGGLEDPGTGLVRFGARDYDPQTGRWTARDPSFYGGSPGNLLLYVEGQPQTFRDPSGLFIGGIVSGLGGICSDILGGLNLGGLIGGAANLINADAAGAIGGLVKGLLGDGAVSDALGGALSSMGGDAPAAESSSLGDLADAAAKLMEKQEDAPKSCPAPGWDLLGGLGKGSGGSDASAAMGDLASGLGDAGSALADAFGASGGGGGCGGSSSLGAAVGEAVGGRF